MREERSKGAEYLRELVIRLTQERIETGMMENGRLPLLMNGYSVGAITDQGTAYVNKDFYGVPRVEEHCRRAGGIGAEVWTYMEQMAGAPPLVAVTLNEPYKLLAEFNGVVLGGMETPYGVQFTTWQRTYGGKGLTWGHYYGNAYSAAKQDFAVRSGLVDEHLLFTGEQMAEIFRCVSFALGGGIDLTVPQEERIKNIQAQIQTAVPNVEAQLTQEIRQGEMKMH